ncbi:uncharacterized protein B0T15DRAFT_542088 [Chaetomium strumarium]|uniref:Uncharacterized protein n=1 Tax=Chaetomium strumarium TaxID=1170767 RepID=A0AAJ0GLL3_9PEZI|nr:hypothetical protein B0T15DRAFT_542088 [Chaetomium strumarium]
MEKAHNWVYIRSRCKGKPSAAQVKATGCDYSPKACPGTAEAMHDPAVASSAPPPAATVPLPATMDFVLFDDGQADAIGDHDDSLYADYDDSEGAQSYLPWSSPSTRLRRNERFIEMFSQTYNGAHEKTGTLADYATVDPMLAGLPPHDIRHHSRDNDQRQSADDVTIKAESPIVSVDAVFPNKRKHEVIVAPSSQPGQAAPPSSGERPSGSRKAGAGQVARTSSNSGVGSEYRLGPDDGPRPRKKQRPNPTEDFTDTSMPDIFRHAHPHIYDRDRADKYSPCHTMHREISTLVRHLSRPAHRLQVTERAISSFEAEGPDFRHPRVGVCRWCWQTFSDRQIFDAHVSRPCEKVSKGKREKWRALYDAFTPLLDATDSPPSGSGDDLTQETEAQRRRFPSQADGSPVANEDDVLGGIGTPPTSVPSPDLLPSAAFGPSNPSNSRFISADEHCKLQEEHKALRERHHQLERVTQVLLARQFIQEKMRTHTSTKSGIESLRAGSCKSDPSVISTASSDRDSLVQHMDSQSTNVDVYRFMDDVEHTRQSISRMNSGLSTVSRSTIHHVPLSPPPRAAGLPTQQQNTGHPLISQQSKQSLAHRPPLPSIPDSGYGTDQCRGSLGDLAPSAEQQHAGTGSPTLGAEEAAERPRFTQELSWTDDSDAFQRGPGGPGTPKPHGGSQSSGFLTEQEMAEYTDSSFELFYSSLQSRSSPTGFTFELGSQQE